MIGDGDVIGLDNGALVANRGRDGFIKQLQPMERQVRPVIAGGQGYAAGEPGGGLGGAGSRQAPREHERGAAQQRSFQERPTIGLHLSCHNETSIRNQPSMDS